MFSAVRYPHPFPSALPVPPPVPLPENAADICSHAGVFGNGVPDRICLYRSVRLNLRKKEHIFRYHGLSHPLLQKNAWKPPAGNCFARCPVSGALSWQHPVSQSVPKNHPKRLHTLRPVPARTPVFPVTDGKFRLYRDVLPVCLAVDRRRGVPCPA